MQSETFVVFNSQFMTCITIILIAGWPNPALPVSAGPRIHTVAN